MKTITVAIWQKKYPSPCSYMQPHSVGGSWWPLPQWLVRMPPCPDYLWNSAWPLRSRGKGCRGTQNKKMCHVCVCVFTVHHCICIKAYVVCQFYSSGKKSKLPTECSDQLLIQLSLFRKKFRVHYRNKLVIKNIEISLCSGGKRKNKKNNLILTSFNNFFPSHTKTALDSFL